MDKVSPKGRNGPYGLMSYISLALVALFFFPQFSFARDNKERNSISYHSKDLKVVTIQQNYNIWHAAKSLKKLYNIPSSKFRKAWKFSKINIDGKSTPIYKVNIVHAGTILYFDGKKNRFGLDFYESRKMLANLKREKNSNSRKFVKGADVILSRGNLEKSFPLPGYFPTVKAGFLVELKVEENNGASNGNGYKKDLNRSINLNNGEKYGNAISLKPENFKNRKFFEEDMHFSGSVEIEKDSGLFLSFNGNGAALNSSGVAGNAKKSDNLFDTLKDGSMFKLAAMVSKDPNFFKEIGGKKFDEEKINFAESHSSLNLADIKTVFEVKKNIKEKAFCDFSSNRAHAILYGFLGGNKHAIFYDEKKSGGFIVSKDRYRFSIGCDGYVLMEPINVDSVSILTSNATFEKFHLDDLTVSYVGKLKEKFIAQELSEKEVWAKLDAMRDEIFMPDISKDDLKIALNSVPLKDILSGDWARGFNVFKKGSAENISDLISAYLSSSAIQISGDDLNRPAGEVLAQNAYKLYLDKKIFKEKIDLRKIRNFVLQTGFSVLLRIALP